MCGHAKWSFGLKVSVLRHAVLFRKKGWIQADAHGRQTRCHGHLVVQPHECGVLSASPPPPLLTGARRTKTWDSCDSPGKGHATVCEGGMNTRRGRGRSLEERVVAPRRRVPGVSTLKRNKKHEGMYVEHTNPHGSNKEALRRTRIQAAREQHTKGLMFSKASSTGANLSE